jgi:hypothetical protein
MRSLHHLLQIAPYIAVAGVTLTAFALDHSQPFTESIAGMAPSENPVIDSNADLDRRLAVCHTRHEARRRIVRELVDGQLTLLQAAERFRDLTETNIDSGMRQLSIRWPGLSNDVCHCKHVISFAQDMYRTKPHQVGLITERLQQELDDLQKRGELRLAP